MVDRTPQEKPTRQFSLPSGCLALVIVIFLGCGGSLWWHSQRGWTAEKLDRLIKAELPPESKPEMVKAWFDRHKIQYGWSDDTTGDSRGKQTMPEIVGLQNAQLSGMYRGHIEGPEANVDLIFSGRITVYFFFDKRGLCAGHLVHPFVHMP